MLMDHFSLKHLLDQRLSTIPQQTWVTKLFGYSFSVEHRPDRLNDTARGHDSGARQHHLAARIHQ
jgi:hypothetical protein